MILQVSADKDIVLAFSHTVVETDYDISLL